MIIRSAEISISAVNKTQYPKDDFHQIAFAGRSNVGKSSALNTLLNRKKLAYTSSTPGKTRTINFFLINKEFYFVDLPGYGYAKISKSESLKFAEFMEEYFIYAKNLKYIFLFADIRHGAKNTDIDMFKYARHFAIPTAVILTKSDKVNKSEIKASENMVKKQLDLYDEPVFIMSSLKKTGRDESLEFVDEILKQG